MKQLFSFFKRKTTERTKPARIINHQLGPKVLYPNALKIIKTLNANGYQGQTYSSVNEALSSAKQLATPQDLIFVGGSTFVVAEVL